MESLTSMVASTSQRTSNSGALELESRAMEAIEEDEGLSLEDIGYAAKAIANNTARANMYLSLKKPSSRTSYILREIESIKETKQ